MKPETIKFIKKLLEAEVAFRQDRMMDKIRWDDNTCIQDSIERYREAYFAYEEFDDWCDEQECE